MKIGFFGNTNNFPLMLARAFQRLGHEVACIVHRTDPLHRPEYRYDDISYPYPDWIHEILLTDAQHFVIGNRQRNRAVGLLRSCDFVILNDLGVSLAKLIARPYLALLTGSDLTY